MREWVHYWNSPFLRHPDNERPGITLVSKCYASIQPVPGNPLCEWDPWDNSGVYSWSIYGTVDSVFTHSSLWKVQAMGYEKRPKIWIFLSTWHDFQPWVNHHFEVLELGFLDLGAHDQLLSWWMATWVRSELSDLWWLPTELQGQMMQWHSVKVYPEI
jgi:hypothetical protein